MDRLTAEEAEILRLWGVIRRSVRPHPEKDWFMAWEDDDQMDCACCGGSGTEFCNPCRGSGADHDGGECEYCEGFGYITCSVCCGGGYMNRETDGEDDE